jgi:hypothetical protein
MGAVSLAPGHQRIDANWQAVAGADSYEVYYSTGAAMPGTPVQTVTTTQAAITALANGTVYYVWIKPRNTYGTGAVSAAVSAKPLGTPAAPVLTADDCKLTVTWAGVEGADQYDVFYSTSAAMPASPAQTGIAGTSATLTGLTNSTTYYVWVRGRNSTGAGAASPATTGKPTAGALYKGPNFGSATKIGVYNLAGAISYISANAQTGDNYFIVLGADETLAPTTLNYPGKTVGITLMTDGVERTVQFPEQWTNSTFITINSGVTLTLENNVTLKGNADRTGSLIRINTSGALIMNGGEISGNTASSSGGGVQVSGGIFTMNSGEITRNTDNTSAVYVSSSGIFTMNGGSISNNNCGGVYVNDGTFTMYNGTISGNIGPYGGGGVHVDGATFVMRGGIISGNIASGNNGYGGGVYVGGTFTMYNGTISSNTASQSGGGVYLFTGTFMMRGGIISDNTASSNHGGGGGGVHINTWNSIFTKLATGGIITGYGNDTTTGNRVVNSSGVVQNDKGHTVRVGYNTPGKILEKTVPANKALDSSVDSVAGGWTE